MSDVRWHRRPEINQTSMKVNTIQPVFEETFYFNGKSSRVRRIRNIILPPLFYTSTHFRLR